MVMYDGSIADNVKLQPDIKLSYFNLTGLAEPIRLLLVYMNWNFTDHRIQYDEWLDVKKDYPFGTYHLSVANPSLKNNLTHYNTNTYNIR
ncbi:glutathione S-transferase P-like, partial [Diaphorina citri]|uniref:Glutathione S-transferase P-like n=1 Tax=Diaphorina citri TaxID=121845 RepID=A0A3Q0JBB6_DIACI